MKSPKGKTLLKDSIFHSSRVRLFALLLLALCPLNSVSAQQSAAVETPSTSSETMKRNDEGDTKDVTKKDRGKTDRKDSSAAEIEQMRSQLQKAEQRIDEMQRQMDEMRAMLKQFTTANNASHTNNTTAVAAPGATRTEGVSNQDAANAASEAVAAVKPAQDRTQEKSTIDKLIKPKSEEGQFSGAEGLLKTDRIKVGGYADFRYVTRGIDEGFEIRGNADEANPGQTEFTNFRRNGFIMPRLVLGVAAAITPKLLFNSEIEFEFAGKETEVEQMYLEYRLHPTFNLRGGIVVPPLGRFNLFHDSNLQDIAQRPLVSTFVIPSTYKDAGIGALGEFKLGAARA